MLNQEKVNQLFYYNPQTGIFIHRTNCPRSKFKKGDTAGRIRNDGYLLISIEGENYYGHRLAFLYMTSRWPEHQVDHINGIRHDNTWSNLRKATQSQNQQNQKKAHKDNFSGLLGAYVSKNGYITSEITCKGKSFNLGSFKSIESAHQAYINAKRKIHEFNTL